MSKLLNLKCTIFHNNEICIRKIVKIPSLDILGLDNGPALGETVGRCEDVVGVDDGPSAQTTIPAAVKSRSADLNLYAQRASQFEYPGSIHTN